MEGDRDNQLGSNKKMWPITWAIITAITVCLTCFSGASGYFVAKVSEGTELPFKIPLYIQLGTTLLVLLISLFESITIVTLVRHMKIKLLDRDRTESHLRGSTVRSLAERDFLLSDILGVYIGTLGVNIGILLVLWSLTIAQMYKSYSEFKGSLWPFIVTDVTVGLISPIIIVFSLVPLLRIIRYVTHGKLETRKLLLWSLPFLSYERGNKGIYWVLEDSFYYKIHNNFCGSLSTALLYSTAALSFLFSWVYFIDDVFIDQIGFADCTQLTPAQKQNMYCFHIQPTDLNTFVNCTVNTTYSGSLFCFEFKEVGRNLNILQSIVISAILYYVFVMCVSLLSQVMKLLQRYARSYLWPTLVVSVGFLMLIFGLIHFVSAVYFNYYLNVLTLFEILIISANITIIGILVAGGHIMQRDQQQSYSENTSIITSPYNNRIGIFEHTQIHHHVALNPFQGVELTAMSASPHNNYSQTPVPINGNGNLPQSPNSSNATGSLPPPSSTPPPPLSSASSLTSPHNNETSDDSLPEQQPTSNTTDQQQMEHQTEGQENTVIVQQISEDSATATAAFVNTTPRGQVVRPRAVSPAASTTSSLTRVAMTNGCSISQIKKANGQIPNSIAVVQEGFMPPPAIPLRVNNGSGQSTGQQHHPSPAARKITIL